MMGYTRAVCCVVSVEMMGYTRVVCCVVSVEMMGYTRAVCCVVSVARGGFSYFITFTDDHSRYGYVYLMRYKSEAFVRFKEFRLQVENQTGRKIKTLRSDRGGEHLSGEFIDCLKQNSIVSQWTPPGTPQLNGVAERRNRTLLDMTWSMMSFTELPLSFWGYALETAVRLLNIAPSKTVAQTPYQIWHGKPASCRYLKVWGSPAYVKRLVGDKLDLRNAVFLERGFPTDTRRDELVLEELSEAPQSNAGTSSAPDVSTDNVPILRRSARVSQPPKRYGFLGMTGQLDNDPKIYGEAMSDIDSEKWLEAMKSEMDSMSSNQVLTLVDRPKGVRPVGCKWVYKRINYISITFPSYLVEYSTDSSNLKSIVWAEDEALVGPLLYPDLYVFAFDLDHHDLHMKEVLLGLLWFPQTSVSRGSGNPNFLSLDDPMEAHWNTCFPPEVVELE
ncbi:UNVERIFIED_CONTAM: Retrovirus-related Pol polyprotein from transposon TNT 1-94 [Sesamum calycinum]|uniref:Retrovirus-related Pol polyprotein from transposon TNT 1-94 n=1 Tax=Sesamum calycinum TaxID=2727403 RepID=A0AAW2K8Z7_9LAMI